MAAQLLIVADPVSLLDLSRSEHSPASNCKHFSAAGTRHPTTLFLHKKNRILNRQDCFAAQAIEPLFGELLHSVEQAAERSLAN
ncbi:MAG: hypothetical protein JNJ67_02165 [Chromatiales bacterium]|nr:hypothetical protein [Chromatiales bacterium]